MDEEYTDRPNFVFIPKTACPQHGATCLKVIKDGDSINFNGKLAKVPKEYTATMKDSSTFEFVFGKRPASPKPTETTQTPASTVTDESVASDSNDETVPTTSTGHVNLASISIILASILFIQ